MSASQAARRSSRSTLRGRQGHLGNHGGRVRIPPSDRGNGQHTLPVLLHTHARGGMAEPAAASPSAITAAAELPSDGTELDERVTKPRSGAQNRGATCRRPAAGVQRRTAPTGVAVPTRSYRALGKCGCRAVAHGRLSSVQRGATLTTSASQASAVVGPRPGLMSKRARRIEPTRHPERNAARSSASPTRRGPQSPAWRSLKHMR